MIVLIVAIGLAAGRGTRLVVDDTLLDSQRLWLMRRAPALVVRLITCPWCVSFWATLAVWGATWIFVPMGAPVLVGLAAWGFAQLVYFAAEYLAASVS